MRKKLFTAALALAVTSTSFVQATTTQASTQAFTDVPTSHYAHKEIIDLSSRGIVRGFGDGTFKPSKQLNRAEFATFVARSLDLPSAESNFKDVSKSSALYDGVSRAYKAGIIKGFSDGTFKPGQSVSRQDMAVMIDRAMQTKGTYTQRKPLNFSDSSTVGAYAKVSVERLYHYNVMAAISGTAYKPTSIGTRADTAKYLYNMLQVLEGGAVTTPPPTTGDIDAIKKKNPLDLTHAEIVKAYGPYVIHMRYDIFGETRGIIEWDIWADKYMEYLKYAKEYKYSVVLRPDAWLKDKKENGFLGSLYSEVDLNYPNYELIALNNKPFTESELMIRNNLAVYNRMQSGEKSVLIPKSPSVIGEFKVDLHLKKHDFAIYQKGQVKFGKQLVLPYTKENKALMVDVKATFTNAPGVSLTASSVSYGGNTITFTNGSSTIQVNGEIKTLSVSPEIKNGVQMLPIREISTHLGLVTRVTTGYYVHKIEIQNYNEVDPFNLYR